MQINSKANPHWVHEPTRARKLSAATRWSHGLLPARGARGPVSVAAVAVMVAAAGCAGVARSPGATAGSGRSAGVASAIDGGQLSRDLMAFAADSMRGRETGTPDAMRAAQFIADRLSSLGLEPVGDSLFYQRVPMVRQVVAPSTRITVTRRGVARELHLGGDILPMMSLGDGQPDPRRLVDADVVFAGYAIASKAPGRNDFQSIGLQDQVVVFLHGAPTSVTGALKDSLDSDAEMTRQLARVAIQRPAAIVVLMTGDATKLYRQLYPNLTIDVRGRLVATPTLAGVQIPMLLFGLAKRGSPLLPPRWPEDDRAQVLDGSHLSADIELRREPFIGFNVVARVAGTDPALRGTYVALGAHYDHIGILPPLYGDSIANGADDDLSVRIPLLAVAKAPI